MRRVRIQQYRKSRSARALSKYLGILRLKVSGSQFRGKTSDVIINWGKVKPLPNVNYLNSLVGVERATNKLTTFKNLQLYSIPIPKYYPSSSYLEEDKKYVARTILYGHSGEGIVVGKPDELPDAPLYVEYIDKVKEYRVIVVGEEAVDVKIKLKKSDWEGTRDTYVWNHSNGYVFARNSGEFNYNLTNIGVQAIKALGLSYGAVDIIEDSAGVLYVLEVNTAFGLEGTTVELVGDALKKLIKERYDYEF